MENRVIKPKKAKKAKKTPKVTKSLVDLVNGNFLTREDVMAHLPFVLFLAFVGLLYIANGYLTEDTVRKLGKIDKDLKELRSEHITTKFDLEFKKNQSELTGIIQEKGLELEETTTPPFKITVTDKELKEWDK